MTPAEHELLMARLKLWKYDYQVFSEQCLQIQGEDTRKIPFKFNRMQRHFWKLEQRCVENKIPFWVLVLKIRRAGSSLYWSNRLFWKMLFNENRNSMIRAQDDPTTQLLFSMPKYSFKFLPPPLDQIKVKLDNRLVWQFEELDSRMFASTVGGENAGAGFGIHDLLLAELGRYDAVTDTKSMLTTIKQTVPFSPEFSIVGETTAHGEGTLKRYWEDDDNGFLKEFISYVALEKYRMETDEFPLSAIDDDKYGNEEVEAELIRKEILRWYADEWNEREHAGEIEHEIYCRLKWRRMMIDRYCEGDKKVFDQEYPITAERAFMLSGLNVFNSEKLHYVITGLKATPPPAKRYRFDPSIELEALRGNPTEKLFDLAFSESGFGQLYIYEPPIEGVAYGMGIDGSDGLVDGDPGALSILRVPDRYEVAHLCKSIDPDLLGEIAYVLGMLYNKALTIVEMQYGQEILAKLRRMRYPLTRIWRNKKWDNIKVDKDKRYGFHSNVNSKQKLIDEYKPYIRDDGMTFNNIENAKEHKGYKLFDDGKYYATGPDGGKMSANRVIATALASKAVAEYPIYVRHEEAAYERNSVKYWERRLGRNFINETSRNHEPVNRY